MADNAFAGVGGEGRDRGGGRYVPSQGPKEHSHPRRVSPRTVSVCDVEATDLIQVIPVGPERPLRAAPQIAGPSTDSDQLRQLIEGDHRSARGGARPVQEARQRDFA